MSSTTRNGITMPTRYADALAFEAEAARLMGSIHDEVMALRPLGVASEFSLVMGARPKQGVVCSIPGGATYAFAKARQPGPFQLAEWADRYERAKVLRRQALDLTGWSICGVGTTVGNRKYMEHGQRLREADLLSAPERSHLALLEAFWAQYGPDENPIGVVQSDGTIKEHK